MTGFNAVMPVHMGVFIEEQEVRREQVREFHVSTGPSTKKSTARAAVLDYVGAGWGIETQTAIAGWGNAYRFVLVELSGLDALTEAVG